MIADTGEQVGRYRPEALRVVGPGGTDEERIANALRAQAIALGEATGERRRPRPFVGQWRPTPWLAFTAVSGAASTIANAARYCAAAA